MFRVFSFFMHSYVDYLSGAKSNHLFPLIYPDQMSDLRNNSQFRQKIPVQWRVIWFLCSPEIYMYSAYQLDYWQVGRITQFEVTCFSLCSIQCHVALGEDGYCFVEWMHNFLAPSFPDQATYLFACFWFFLLSFALHHSHGITKGSNVNVLQSDNGFKEYSLKGNAQYFQICPPSCPTCDRCVIL